MGIISANRRAARVPHRAKSEAITTSTSRRERGIDAGR